MILIQISDSIHHLIKFIVYFQSNSAVKSLVYSKLDINICTVLILFFLYNYFSIKNYII